MKKRKREPRQSAKTSSIGTSMTVSSGKARMTSHQWKSESVPNIFARLEERHIDYEQVKRIVQFDVPHNTLRFAQWFKGRTIKDVLRHFDKWRAFLEKDFILRLSSEVKGQVEQFVFGTEWMVCQALVEANPRVGPWDLRFRFLPTGQDENGRYVFIHPAIQLEAVHNETKERRTAQIPGGKSLSPSESSTAFRKAVNDLGLWNEMWKRDPSGDLISNRSPHAWPVFTKFIVPHLYEFMLPYYHLPPHYSEKLDKGNPAPKRPGRYSKALFRDMLEILKMEHDWAFEEATVSRLQGVIQRHLARKPTQTG